MGVRQRSQQSGSVELEADLLELVSAAAVPSPCRLFAIARKLTQYLIGFAAGRRVPRPRYAATRSHAGERSRAWLSADTLQWPGRIQPLPPTWQTGARFGVRVLTVKRFRVRLAHLVAAANSRSRTPGVHEWCARQSRDAT